MLFPLSSSHILSLSSYILSRLSMIVGSNIGVLTYLHLHLYPHMPNWTAHSSFSYLVKFMPVVAELVQLNYASSCSVIYILHSKFSWSTIPPCTQPFFPFLDLMYYHFLVIYLVAFIWSRVPALAGWHIFISMYILTWQIRPTIIPFHT